MSFTFRQVLVANKNLKLKCPNAMTPEYFTVHNTYNDASAANEIQYMINSPREVSYHYAIDDKEVIQGVSTDRNAWHCGDGNGTGNRKSIGIEICYSKSGGERYKKAEQNTIVFLAQELKKRGWGIDRVKKHEDWSGKHCPHRILDEGRWNSFKQAIQAEMYKRKEEPKMKIAIVVNSLADLGPAEVLRDKLKAPIVLGRDFVKGQKIASEVYIVGGANEPTLGDKVTHFGGVNRFDVAQNVRKFVGM